MNIGTPLITSDWQKLETLVPDFAFVDESAYLLQVQGEGKVRFCESESEPSANSENGILTTEKGFPIKLTKESGKDIYVKVYGVNNNNTYVDIELLGV